MATQTTDAHAANAATPARPLHSKWLLMTGSAGALGAALLFLAGLLALAMPDAGGLMTLLRGNWLITIFRLQAGYPGMQAGALYRLNALDLLLLALIVATHAGLYCALHRSRRILALIAVVQPPLGMLLFLLTHSAGRSGVMGAGLCVSAAMLGSRFFGKPAAWVGLLASILLLAGDFGTGLAPNGMLALATGTGYILLIGWLLVVARRLAELAR